MRVKSILIKMSEFHFVTGTGASGGLLASPVADFNAGGSVTDIVSMSKYEECYFILHWGVGTTGTCTLTVVPTDDFVPSNTTTAIPFQYKRISAGETNTAWTASSSLLTTAGSHQIYVIKVIAQDLPTVSGAVYENVKLVSADTNSAALLGGCIIMMAKPRYNEATLDGVTA